MRKRSEAALKEVETEAEKRIRISVDPEFERRQMEEASTPLAQALKDAENVDDPSFGSLPDWKPAHPGFDRVVSKVFVKEEDFEETYEKLTSLLRSLEGRNERAFWKDSLGRAAEGHHLAARLYTTAQKILANWEADNGVVCATMRERAYRELQEEKKQNQRNKTITDKDVDDRATLIYPTDFPRFSKQRGEYSLMGKNLEMLVKSFDHLNNNLRVLTGST
jgi:hypothetical protein